jgi:hypothetical protein
MVSKARSLSRSTPKRIRSSRKVTMPAIGKRVSPVIRRAHKARKAQKKAKRAGSARKSISTSRAPSRSTAALLEDLEQPMQPKLPKTSAKYYEFLHGGVSMNDVPTDEYCRQPTLVRNKRGLDMCALGAAEEL